MGSIVGDFDIDALGLLSTATSAGCDCPTCRGWGSRNQLDINIFARQRAYQSQIRDQDVSIMFFSRREVYREFRVKVQYCCPPSQHVLRRAPETPETDISAPIKVSGCAVLVGIHCTGRAGFSSGEVGA
jgi:hypothetical protein